MKRILAATTALWLTLTPAYADVPTFDAANAIAQGKQLLQSLKDYGLQLEQYTTQVRQAATEASQLVQLTTQVASTIQHPSLGGAMALMGQFGISNPLPINPYAVMSLTSGLNSGAGLQGIMNNLGNLGSLVTASSSINHVYTCTDQSFSCQVQQQQANANAGYQGVIGKIYTDLTNHLNITNALRGNLLDSTDPAQRENAIAQLTAEQNWVSTAQAELNSATALYQAQQFANANRERENYTQSIDTMLANMPKQ
jgi:hypothetical protein